MDVYRVEPTLTGVAVLMFARDDLEPEAWEFAVEGVDALTIPQVVIDRSDGAEADFIGLVGASTVFAAAPEVLDGLPELTAWCESFPLEVVPVASRLDLIVTSRLIDCLDPTASGISQDPFDLSFAIPERYVFERTSLPADGLFRIPQTESVDLFLVENRGGPSLRTRVQERELRGLDFQLMWSTEETSQC